MENKVPNFLISTPISSFDRQMDPLKTFMAQVVAFGECDGFASIGISQSPDCSTDQWLPDGWIHNPPDHYLIANIDGTTENMIDYRERESKASDLYYDWFSELSKAELKKLMAAKDPKLEEPFTLENETIFWCVNFKASLVGSEAKLGVRHGFWTRVVSESLEVALKCTFKLWAAENALPDEKKFGDLETDDDDLKEKKGWLNPEYILSLCREDDSIKPLLNVLERYSESDKEFKNRLSVEQAFQFYEFLNDLETDLKDVKRSLRDELADPSFKEFLAAEKQIDKETEKKNREITSGRSRPWKELKEGWEQDAERREKFLDSLRIKKEE